MSESTIISSKVDTRFSKAIVILECVLSAPFVLIALLYGVWIGLVFVAGPIWTFYCYRKAKDVRLTVTNKRVIFTGGAFGIERNIPIDSISSVSKGFLRTIKINSSGGVINLSFIERHQHVYNVINDLINTRNHANDDVFSISKEVITPLQSQPELENEKKSESTSCSKPLNDDTINILRKYKQLLDEGIITQEEFDEKKRQLL